MLYDVTFNFDNLSIEAPLSELRLKISAESPSEALDMAKVWKDKHFPSLKCTEASSSAPKKWSAYNLTSSV